MGMDPLAVTTRGLPAAPDHQAAERQEIRRLAQEFEALLMTQMLRDMRHAMVDDDEQNEGLGSGALFDASEVELARVLSRAGGLGLTDALLGAFERQVAPDTTVHPVGRTLGREAPAVEQPPVPDEARASRFPPDMVATLTDRAPISSAFGWRRDPFTGAARFHQGIDIALKYGAEVRAAAAGHVSFSGVQGGYGHTVVIDHGTGRQTRYAHLSDASVRDGDAVTEGQIIGRSGASGRSSGPHLHFELLVDGTPVDPAGGTD
jgi:murein DD-endopeptidase MepM/ murein hydrolase activator NlpD